MKKRLLCLTLALIMIFSLLPMSAFAEGISGKCGDNATWTLKDGILTISGTGDMYDYDHNVPWDSFCDEIKTVIVKDGITSIGDNAGFGFVRSIVISDTVTRIGEGAFRHCDCLIDVTIPASVTSIGKGAFNECSSLTSFNVDTANMNYCSIDGILYTKDVTTLIQCPCRKAGKVTIPDSVTSIDTYAFSGCTSLRSIDIPAGVTSIGAYVFAGCGLTSIELPVGVTSIGEYAFLSCSGLKSIDIPAGVTNIGDSAFSCCENLTSIGLPDSVTSIGSGAVSNCGLTDVYYGGTSVQWNNISIGPYNDALLNAALHIQGGNIEISKQPSNLKAASGTTGRFTVTASGDGLRYQWQYQTLNDSWNNCTATSGKTATLSVNVRDELNGYKYRCKITDANGNRVTSSTATLTVTPALEISKQPSSLKAASGTTGKFSVTATGDGLKYQWQYQKPGTTTWVNSTATSGKTATFTVNAREAINGYKYRCKVTDASGNSVTSGIATLTVTPGITKQPANIKVQNGTTGKLTITAAGDGLSYQWQYQKPGTTTWVNSTASSGKTASFSINAREAIDGYKYRCVVKNSCGNSITSSVATLTVVYDLAITKQPTNLTAASGTTGKLKVTAVGTGLSYQWQYQKPGTTTWVNSTASSGKTASFSINVREAIDGYKYRCIVKDTLGDSVTSNTVTLKVN